MGGQLEVAAAPDPTDEPGATAVLGSEQDGEKILKLKTFHHFFGAFSPWLQGVHDPRRVRRLDVGQAQECVTRLVEILIDSKVLYPYRFRGRYFLVAVDGTGTLVYRQRHCPFCLTKTHNGKTLYYHNVLEAKLVGPNGFAFSLLSEFIENHGENVAKQDCELKAFYRLAKRLKARFPRLPLALLCDGLFANGTVFGLCRKYRWAFFITLKDDQLASVNEEFNELSRWAHPLVYHTGKDAAITQTFRWANDIDYARIPNHPLQVDHVFSRHRKKRHRTVQPSRRLRKSPERRTPAMED